MVQRYTESELSRLLDVRAQRRSKIVDEQSARNYVAGCRDTIRHIYGSLDHHDRPPAHPRTVGMIEHDRYTIEKIVFESLPSFLVTANLYVPKRSDGNADNTCPCVLGTCGHSERGKAEEKYQRFCASLAIRGFLVLLFDPIGQGERKQYPNREHPITGCVGEHVVLGTKLALLGDFFGSYRAWDAIRALDVLLERPEADATRVGLTGNSGGGTMTTIVTALEDRLTMAAPSCFITTYRRNLENELPADTEQIPPGIIAGGYELYDHLTASAPRPTLILGKEDDFFDRRGTEEAYQELKKIYRHLGREDDLELTLASGGHGFDRELREAMVRFFCKHAGLDEPGDEPEDLEVHRPEELAVAPSESVSSLGSRLVMDLVRDKAALIDEIRETQAATAADEPFAETLATALGFDRSKSPADTPEYRVLRPRDGQSRISVQSEPGIDVLLRFNPVDGPRFSLPATERGIIYLPGSDPIEEEERRPELTALTEAHERSGLDSFVRYVVSPRGMGESRYDTCNGSPYTALYDADFLYTSYGIMMDRPLIAGRIHDVVSVVRLLEGKGCKRFTLAGRGCGAILALLAAPFIKSVDRVFEYGGPDSLMSLVRSPGPMLPISFLPVGLLRTSDLPDVRTYLEARGTHVSVEQPARRTTRY